MFQQAVTGPLNLLMMALVGLWVLVRNSESYSLKFMKDGLVTNRFLKLKGLGIAENYGYEDEESPHASKGEIAQIRERKRSGTATRRGRWHCRDFDNPQKSDALSIQPGQFIK